MLELAVEAGTAMTGVAAAMTGEVIFAACAVASPLLGIAVAAAAAAGDSVAAIDEVSAVDLSDVDSVGGVAGPPAPPPHAVNKNIAFASKQSCIDRMLGIGFAGILWRSNHKSDRQ